MCKSSCGDSVKIENIAIINNIIYHHQVPAIFAKAGGIKCFVSLLGRNLKDAYIPGFNVFREIADSSQELAAQVNDAGFMSMVTKIISKPDKLSVTALTNALLAIRNIARHSNQLQKAISTTPGIFEALLALFDHSEFQTSEAVLQALTKAIACIVAGDSEIQNMCVDANAVVPMLMVARANKYRELQTCAINVSGVLGGVASVLLFRLLPNVVKLVPE